MEIELPEPKRFVINHEVVADDGELDVETHRIEADLVAGVNNGVIALVNTTDGTTLLVDSDFFQAGWTEGVR